ncbi:MAG: MBL fold metallo-hydrolase, partial [Gammaproteobacteria bacterium]
MRKAIIHLLVVFLLSFFSTVTLADYMRVSLLGTGSPRPDTKRMGPAVLVEAGGEYLLFDTGRGVIQRLKQLDVPIAEIHNVFLTHL